MQYLHLLICTLCLQSILKRKKGKGNNTWRPLLCLSNVEHHDAKFKCILSTFQWFFMRSTTQSAEFGRQKWKLPTFLPKNFICALRLPLIASFLLATQTCQTIKGGSCAIQFSPVVHKHQNSNIYQAINIHKLWLNRWSYQEVKSIGNCLIMTRFHLESLTVTADLLCFIAYSQEAVIDDGNYDPASGNSTTNILKAIKQIHGKMKLSQLWHFTVRLRRYFFFED